MKAIGLVAALVICSLPPAFAAGAPARIALWPAGAPGAAANAGEETVRVTEQGEHVVANVNAPSLTPYLPSGTAPRTAVIVVPGGGYRELWTDHEGHNVARALNAKGIAAFVLYYRLPRMDGSPYSVEKDSLADIQRAIRTVRARAAEWAIDPRRIGVLGFSAGGHLALLAATRYDAGAAAAANPVERASSRPDFAAPIYAGSAPGWKIDAQTPPMFLLCGGDDRPDVVAGATQVYTALHAVKVPAELHIYDGVGHGFGLRTTNTGPVAGWLDQFVAWLQTRTKEKTS